MADQDQKLNLDQPFEEEAQDVVEEEAAVAKPEGIALEQYQTDPDANAKKNAEPPQEEVVKEKQVCDECHGRGLIDDQTLCANCNGSGNV